MNRIFTSFTEGFKIALSSLWANKMRAILTTTCIVIGIVSVTAMNTITDGVDRAFEDSMDMLGRNVVFVEKWPWGFGGEYKWWEYRNRRELEVGYVDQLRDLVLNASEVSANVYRGTSVRFEDRTAEGVGLAGATASYFETAGLDIGDGRPFTDSDEQRAAKVVVLGAGVADHLFPDSDPIGERVRIRGQRFMVIGVLEKQGSFLGMEDLDNQMVIPISAMASIFDIRNNVRLSVQFPSEELMVDGEYEVIGAMRQIRGLDPMDDDDFAINKAALFEQEFQGMKVVIYGIGIFLTGLALFVGGIGVMNIMFVSVKERTKEIGIRKAVGAQPWEILLQFLMESIVICMLGGVIGVLLSVGITQIINQFFIAYMDWTTVLNAILICTFVGILFGYLPSNKAAKSNPIESLRYE
ncbi:ABC transporter permease [Rhodohalobacter halophilus]|uniref:ABC transporter permease n=1 Tax=Rhodohalobacter halophilus TaxID=1812810 RepID=UPI00083FC1E3|nr:ABC transporter permease [Rhodohalobacter halophilus]